MVYNSVFRVSRGFYDAFFTIVLVFVIIFFKYRTKTALDSFNIMVNCGKKKHII